MKRTTAILALGLITATGTALAGLNYGAYDITVNPTGKAAGGGINMARRTADSVQYIVCGASSFTGSTTQGSCYARDKTYASGFCSTTDPQMIDTIRSITPSAYISFGWNDTGACTFVSVSNGSSYAY